MRRINSFLFPPLLVVSTCYFLFLDFSLKCKIFVHLIFQMRLKYNIKQQKLYLQESLEILLFQVVPEKKLQPY